MEYDMPLKKDETSENKTQNLAISTLATSLHETTIQQGGPTSRTHGGKRNNFFGMRHSSMDDQQVK